MAELAELIQSFPRCRADLSIPDERDALATKLYATYQSFLPEDDFVYALTMHKEERESFSEFVRTDKQGQFSANIIKPHVTKDNHWHHTKHEKFLLVAGEGFIRFRQINSDKIIEYKVSGERHEVVHTVQNYDYELNQIFFEELELCPPDYFLNCAGDNLGQTMGNILAKSYKILCLPKSPTPY